MFLSYSKKKEISQNDHWLSFVVTRCHFLSLVVCRFITRCHSLSLSFVVTRCTIRLPFYKRSKKKMKAEEVSYFCKTLRFLLFLI